MDPRIETYLSRAPGGLALAEPRELRVRLRQLADLLREAPAMAGGAARLIWRVAGGEVKFVVLFDEVVAGRKAECAVRLESPQASGRHFRVWPEEGTWLIEDLGSTNGTRVNGKPLRVRRTIVAGDAIVAGGLVVFFDVAENS